MKKVLFEISGEERNRILEMHQTATSKQYLNEGMNTGDELELLEIVSIIDKITDRIDIDYSLLVGEEREMYKKLGSIESIITTSLLPKYDLFNINSNSWKSMVSKLSNPSVNIESMKGVSEFINEVRTLIKKEFPMDSLDDLREKLNQFNESLNKLINN
jgi:hypothetical protein